MRRFFKNFYSAVFVITCAAQFALATPQYSELTSAPWKNYRTLEVLGNVNANEFWLLSSDDYSCAMYKSDGTDSGTKKLYDLFVGRCGTLSKDRLFKDNAWYFGMARDVSNSWLRQSEGEELWVADSAGATEIVINPGPDGSSPGGFYSDGVVVYFAATTKTHGRELWTTTGTQSSTALFKDINPGPASSNPANMVFFNDYRYFSADDGVNGVELWRTSGLPSRVELYKNINPTAQAGSNITALFPFGGLLFISANDGKRGQNLWATTGFPLGFGSKQPNETALFKDLVSDKSVNPKNFFVDSGKLHFLADTLGADGNLKSVLWQSDATATGTSVKYTFPGVAKYLGSAGDAGLAFSYESRYEPRGVIVGPTVVELGQAYYPSIVNESYYFMKNSVWPVGVFRFDPYAVPNIESITAVQPGPNSFILHQVLATSATRAVMFNGNYHGYFSVVDKSCTSGYKKNPGQCGCEVADMDTDKDRTPDCLDGCPTDGSKTAPGSCGCGKADTDTDRDGTLDCRDACPQDPSKTAPGQCGCGVADTDKDSDGTLDCKDLCPTDPTKVSGGKCGCGVADKDSDRDGQPDCVDECPADPNKFSQGQCGCGKSDVDTDYDRTPDCRDNCPNDPLKAAWAGSCGCGKSEVDTDRDGTPDCLDLCPRDVSKLSGGVCGCGVIDTDSDRDGTADCKDKCPSDPRKTSEGTCGCGVVEHDDDRDGVANCKDQCPQDASKQVAGACGCGTPDNDSDGDGLADCQDSCMQDQAKTAPGACGCGVPDTDADQDGIPDCQDKCPTDSSKNQPGLCGCGSADADGDGDGAADCNDQCPHNPQKQSPGTCGCEAPDQDLNRDGIADCLQTTQLSKVPAAPTIDVGKRTLTVTVPASSAASSGSGTYNVFYQFQSRVRGRTTWSRITMKRSSVPVVKIPIPKSAIGVKAYYQITIPGLSNRSPQSPEAQATLR